MRIKQEWGALKILISGHSYRALLKIHEYIDTILFGGVLLFGCGFKDVSGRGGSNNIDIRINFNFRLMNGAAVQGGLDWECLILWWREFISTFRAAKAT